ncbi:MAG: hypothetical protein A3K65_07670 [Euryarchaeota archaeon RBG_16_68_12]|nr:MAG: hypothetical protein A3K65_07670 [Euryarchaeota archaeon RBG_16_68_12]
MKTSAPIRAIPGFPSGRTVANGSFTGPNTFTTRPTGRRRRSTTTAPRGGANPARTRMDPSYAMFSTVPRAWMPPVKAFPCGKRELI